MELFKWYLDYIVEKGDTSEGNLLNEVFKSNNRTMKKMAMFALSYGKFGKLRRSLMPNLVLDADPEIRKSVKRILLSDILEEGIIYAVEFAERSIRQLIQNTSERNNIIPILGDARFPIKYANKIFTEIDLIYQDVAQPNQAEIAVKNCEYYLKEEGILILAIKSQSIDSVSKSSKVYKEEQKILEKAGLEVLESVNIHKYAANHIVLLAKKSIIKKNV